MCDSEYLTILNFKEPLNQHKNKYKMIDIFFCLKSLVYTNFKITEHKTIMDKQEICNIDMHDRF